MQPPPRFIRLTLPSSHQCPRSISSRHNSALIFLTSWLHFLLFQGLVVLVNNWFWLSQCADKDNSRAIKSSSSVLSSCPPSLYRQAADTYTHTILYTQTHTHIVLCLFPHVIQPSYHLSLLLLTTYPSVQFTLFHSPLSSLFVCFLHPSQALLILLTSFVVFSHLNLT